MSLENRLLESNTKAISRNQEILNRDFKHVTCDQKYQIDLDRFKELVKDVEQIIADLDTTDFDLQFRLDNISLCSEILEYLRFTYSRKRAVSQYTMHYIQNLEVILQNKIKLYNLKQQ